MHTRKEHVTQMFWSFFCKTHIFGVYTNLLKCT
jgi:hypothetical protein